MGAMARGPNFTNTGELIRQTQVYNHKRPIYFDVYTVIAKNSIYRPQGFGNTCGGLAWEKTYMSNDKYMCWDIQDQTNSLRNAEVSPMEEGTGRSLLETMKQRPPCPREGQSPPPIRKLSKSHSTSKAA
jgi:hypothetical protein